MIPVYRLLSAFLNSIRGLESRVTRFRASLIYAWNHGHEYRSLRKNRFGFHAIMFRYSPKVDDRSVTLVINEGAFPNIAIRLRWLIIPTFFYCAVMVFGKARRLILGH